MPTPFTIRAATPDDTPRVLPLVKQICDLHHAMDPERFTFRDNLLDMYARWLPERARDPRSPYFVATVNDDVVGYLVGTIEPEVPIYWTPESGWIHDVFVEPAHRAKGIAGALVDAAIAEFTRLGVARIRLETAAPNESARVMFRAHAFRPGTTEMLKMLTPRRRD